MAGLLPHHVDQIERLAAKVDASSLDVSYDFKTFRELPLKEQMPVRSGRLPLIYGYLSLRCGSGKLQNIAVIPGDVKYGPLTDRSHGSASVQDRLPCAAPGADKIIHCPCYRFTGRDSQQSSRRQKKCRQIFHDDSIMANCRQRYE